MSRDPSPWAFSETSSRDASIVSRPYEEIPFFPHISPLNLLPSNQESLLHTTCHTSYPQEEGGLDSSRLWGACQNQHLSSSDNDRLLFGHLHVEHQPSYRGYCQAEYVSTRKSSEILSKRKSRVTKRRTARYKSTRLAIAVEPVQITRPRSYCQVPGCGDSTSREVDMKRHMKTSHWELLSPERMKNNFEFRCKLCRLEINEKKKPRDEWIFPLKYNLTE